MELLRQIGVFFSILLLGILVGCGGVESGIPVTGVVTLDGSPVGGTTVTFSPVNGGGVAVGMTDGSGRYSLSSGVGTGARPGTYAVTITKIDSGSAPATGPDPREMGPDLTEEQRQKILEAAKTQQAARDARDTGPASIPERYGSTDTSGLSAVVEPGGRTEFNFELTSQ